MKNNQWIPMPRFLLRKNTLTQLLKAINLKDKKCLEIGYGSGEILKLLAKKGSKVDGFDFSSDAKELAQKRIENFDFYNNINLLNNENQISENKYDYVFAFEVLEHIEGDKEELEKWYKYLKSDGCLILSVPAHMSKWSDSDIWAGHFRRYEKEGLQILLKKSKFRINKIWNYGFPLSNILDWFLARQKKKEIQFIKGKIDKSIQSKKSGIDRKNILIYKILFNDFVLYPFYLLQKLFLNKDIGSGYIVYSEKLIKTDED